MNSSKRQLTGLLSVLRDPQEFFFTFFFFYLEGSVLLLLIKNPGKGGKYLNLMLWHVFFFYYQIF